ncbi:hypothetical protein [Streptomyces sp. NPDC013455]|uniref:hypothetical protein n=1 Tax=Streptomyces sp. NPDC013455 TaxID=3155605 RepID=UPI0033CAD29A
MQHRLLEGEGGPALPGVRLAQLLVEALEFPGPRDQFGFHRRPLTVRILRAATAGAGRHELGSSRVRPVARR